MRWYGHLDWGEFVFAVLRVMLFCEGLPNRCEWSSPHLLRYGASPQGVWCEALYHPTADGWTVPRLFCGRDVRWHSLSVWSCRFFHLELARATRTDFVWELLERYFWGKEWRGVHVLFGPRGQSWDVWWHSMWKQLYGRFRLSLFYGLIQRLVRQEEPYWLIYRHVMKRSRNRGRSLGCWILHG